MRNIYVTSDTHFGHTNLKQLELLQEKYGPNGCLESSPNVTQQAENDCESCAWIKVCLGS